MTRHHRRLGATLSAILVAVTTFAAEPPPASEEVVKLPPFEVTDFSSFLGFTWNLQLERERVKSITFSRVERRSLAEKAGLFVDDELIAIDGSPIRGVSIAEFQRLFARDAGEATHLEWTFTVRRRTLRVSERTISLRMRVK